MEIYKQLNIKIQKIQKYFRYSNKNKKLTFIEKKMHKNGLCPYCASNNIISHNKYNETHNVNDMLEHTYTCSRCGFIVFEIYNFSEYEFYNNGFSKNKIIQRFIKIKQINEKINNI